MEWNMPTNMSELWIHRELLKSWTARNIKIRYKQSLLGSAWAILQPLALMIVFSIVFNRFVRVPTEGVPYPIFSYTALLPWTFLATSITFGASSLTQNLNLVTKIYLPREILPISEVGASFVDFVVASVVFVGLAAYYDVRITEKILVVPALVIIQICLIVGVVLALAAMNVFYRDIRFVVPLAVTLWMYATPIIYPVELVPENLRRLYFLNPMAGLIESYRSVLLLSEWPNWGNLAVAAVISLVVLVLGYRFFKRVEWQFADVI
jgi:lipopolysaccharide transport system permease protein